MIEDRAALPNVPEVHIGQNILSHIQSLNVHESQRIAVFDLDNTLLVGDIGDAVLAKLVVSEEVDKHHWREYRDLLGTDRAEACRKAISAMAGLPLKTLVRTTLWVLNEESTDVTIDGFPVAIPRPHTGMRSLVQSLLQLNYQVHVITASNQVSSQIAGSQLFGIPEENIHGVRSRVVVDALTGELIPPIPIGQGKIDTYAKFVGDSPPLIVAGDSPMEIPLMQMVPSSGICIWVGESRVISEIARGKLGRPQGFYFVQRPSSVTSEFQEERAYI